MSPAKTRRGAPPLDLDEIAPNRFMIHNPRAVAMLKGEGKIDGRLFELTTWRREGLLARLREREFRVRTIADRLEALPEPPRPVPIGAPGWRALTSAIEQISHFDLRNLRWHPLTPILREGISGVMLYEGWVLRRRKGRGASSYYQAAAERGGGIRLLPLDETTALLTGYAQALALDNRPLLAERRPAPLSPGRPPDRSGSEQLLLPDVELPPPYRELLPSIATRTEEGWLVDERGWLLAQDLFGRLGARLTVAP